jgi:hypothetical protein
MVVRIIWRRRSALKNYAAREERKRSGKVNPRYEA